MPLFQPNRMVHAIKVRFSAGRLGRNALFAVAQTIFSIICVFAAYRVLIAYVGIEQVGVWSLLSAGSSLSRLGDVSGGGALARYVAVERAKTGDMRTVDYIHTVLLTTIVFNGFFGLLLFLVSDYVILDRVDPRYLGEARMLMPLAILNVVAGAVATTLLSGVDGTQRVDHRAVIAGGSALIFLLMTIALTPRLGAVGFGLAIVAQQLFSIAGAWIMLRRHIPALGLVPTRWNRGIFWETAGFGMKIQATSLASVLFEPLAKFILSQYGGLAQLGVYELASRLVVQARSLIIAAIQPLIAAFAGMQNQDRQASERLLMKATYATIVTTLFMTLAIVIASPVVARLMLGTPNRTFMALACALACGWGLNTLSAPIYFAALARGQMRWNLAGHWLITLATLGAGWLLGPVFGGPGVVFGIVLGLSVGMVVQIIGNAYALNMAYVLRHLALPLAGAALGIAAITIGGAFVLDHWLGS